MAKLPNSFRTRNRTSRKFREQYAQLPDEIKKLVRLACIQFDRDPSHRSLRHHQLKDTKRSKQAPNSFSVSPTMQYRAIYVVENGINVWYWIGTHAEYDRYTGDG